MKLLSTTILITPLLSAVHAASAVKDLIPSNFDDLVLKSGKPALVEFFAPWCGHCKNLAPVYEELAVQFQHAEDKVIIAKVDADEHKDLGRRFGVQGFPTLKWFDGKSPDPIDYNSGRDLESLSAFVTDKTGIKAKAAKKPASKVVQLKDSSFKKAIGGDKNVLVAFTAPWCGHCKALKPIWEDLATTFSTESSVVIAQVDAEDPGSKATAQEQNVSSYPTIKYWPAGSETPQEYQGGRQENDFVAFLNKEAGTHRKAGGGLDVTGGTVAAIDAVLEKLRSAGKSASDGAEEIKKAATGSDEKDSKWTEYYIKVSEKLKSNSGYVEKELKRLGNILKKGGLTAEKQDELTGRTNILRKFNLIKSDEKSEL